MPVRKPRIAVDMDDVIADPLSKFIKLFDRDFGIGADFQPVPGQEIFESVPPHAGPKWIEYINEKGFFRDLDPMPDSIEVLQKLQEKYEVFIVSAAMEFPNSLQDKYDWLRDHFPFIDWKHIVFCGIKIVDVDIMIDDRIRNFEDFKGRALLYSSPHNMLIQGYERVNNWKEIAGLLL